MWVTTRLKSKTMPSLKMIGSGSNVTMVPCSFVEPIFLTGGLFLALAVFLHVDAAVLVDHDLRVDGKSVDDGCADAMEAAGDFVAGIFAAEFAAGMEDGHDHLERGDFCLLVDIDGNAAAVVDDAHAIAGQERDLDVIGEAAHGLVARVVEDLPDQMMQAVRTGRADVHARALADRLEALQDLDRVGAIGVFFGLGFWGVFRHK